MLISQFYKNQDIFITGGSGFIGKALIEKLLRSCPEVRRIFVLLRTKKDKNIEERLRAFMSEKLFDRVRREQPQTIQKVYAIAGDCAELGLGICPADLEKLKDVSVIFHSAASVRFDDPLKKSVLLNTRGAYELVKFAETLEKLKAFVHISTTYCNPDKHVVEEKIYPPYADWRTTIKLAETYDTDLLNILNMKYGDNQPNTYTFSKSLSEQIMNEYKDRLPVLVFRPSIVISSIEEPEPGWVDNFNGPVGMLVACGLGLMRTNYGDPDMVSDFMPVDIVARALIIAAYKKGLETIRGTSSDEQLQVYNCSSSKISSVTTGEIVEIGRQCVLKNPLERTLWMPGGGITRCWYWHFIRLWTMHILMAVIVDTGLRLTKKKPMLLKLQRRIYEASIALHYFMTTYWEFKNEKFFSLENEIPKQELDKFGIVKYTIDVDTQSFFENSIRGAKIHLLKESPDSSIGARRRLAIFKALHYFLQLIGSLLIVRFLLRFIYLRYFK